MATDVHGDGRVTNGDARAILLMALSEPDAPAARGLFGDETHDFTDTVRCVFTNTRQSVLWDKTIAVDPAQNVSRNLVGVLLGDVDDSWSPPAGTQYVETMDPGYFSRLAQSMNVSQAQWLV